jgi:hypothetical protein
MDTLFSHRTALSLLRDPTLEAWSRPTNGELLRAPASPADSFTARDLLRENSALRRAGEPLDFLSSDPNGARVGNGFISHVWAGDLPMGSVTDIGHGLFCSSAKMVALQLATSITELELVALLCEFMGTYSIAPGLAGGMSNRPVALCGPEDLKKFLDACAGRRGVKSLRRAGGLAFFGSASPRETKLALRLCLPAVKKGYGLKLLSMNEPVEVERIGGHLRGRGIRKPDILIAPWPGSGAGPVAVEYDGEESHMTREGVLSDTKRGNELKAMGIGEYRVNRELYRNIDYMDDLVFKIREEAGYPRRHRSAADGYRLKLRHLELYRELERVSGIF